MVDEWSGFADLMANLIAKYATVLDLDSLPDPEIKLSDFPDCESGENSFDNVEKKLSA